MQTCTTALSASVEDLGTAVCPGKRPSPLPATSLPSFNQFHSDLPIMATFIVFRDAVRDELRLLAVAKLHVFLLGLEVRCVPKKQLPDAVVAEADSK